MKIDDRLRSAGQDFRTANDAPVSIDLERLFEANNTPTQPDFGHSHAHHVRGRRGVWAIVAAAAIVGVIAVAGVVIGNSAARSGRPAAPQAPSAEYLSALVDIDWSSTSVTDFHGHPQSDPWHYTMRIRSDGALIYPGSCASPFATVRLSADSMTVSDSHRKACYDDGGGKLVGRLRPGGPRQTVGGTPWNFGHLADGTYSWSVSDGTLTISNKAGYRMTLGRGEPASSLTRTPWAVDYWEFQPPGRQTVVDGDPWPKFEIVGDRFTFTGMCVAFAGQVAVHGQELLFSEVTTTSKTCYRPDPAEGPDPAGGLDDTARVVFSEGTSNWVVQDDTLQLRRGEVTVFAARMGPNGREILH